jgi:aspartate/methionine/tyrosine aminotransferase
MITGRGRVVDSTYMQWAKLRSHSKFNLATSGVPNLPLLELPFCAADLELTTAAPYGYPPLVEAIAAKFGVAVDNVVTAEGTSMANHLAMAGLVEPGDEVVMELPVYEPILSAARYLGLEVRFFERRREDLFAVDADRVEQLVTPRTRLVVLTNLHNPSSAFLREETVLRVGEVAARAGARVLVDEVYLDAVYEGTPRSAFHLGPAFLVTSSLTKLYGLSGLRCGWVLADPAAARRMWRLNDLFAASPVHLAEQLGVVAFRHLDRLRARGRTVIDANRRVLHAFYDARRDLDAPRFPWGTTSFPRLLSGRVERLCELLRDRYETTVVPGSYFGAGEHFRIGLTCEPAVLAAGLERLGAALDELSRN